MPSPPLTRASPLAALLVLASCPWPLTAQGEGEEPVDTVFYDTATVESRPIESATAAAEVLDAAALDRSLPLDVSDALDFATGLFLERSSRGGVSAALMRGGDPNFSLVVLDGVPLNDATDTFGGSYDLTTLPTLGLERVEVVRGPESSFYGSTAMSGVIRLIPVTGESADPGTVAAQIEGGSFELIWGGISAAGRLGDRGFGSVAANYDREEGRVGDARFEQGSVLASLGRELGDSGELRAVVRWADRAVDDYAQGSGGPLLGSAELRTADGVELAAGLTSELLTAGWRHTGRLGFLRHGVERDSPAIPPQVPPSSEDRRYQTTRGSWIATAPTQVRLGLGAEVVREEGRDSGFLLLPDFLGGAVPTDYDQDRTTSALFVEGGQTFEGGGEWTLDAGLRLDLPENEDDEWSPRLGVTWRLPQAHWRLRLSAGRAFKLPSLYALGSPPQLGGNPELRPEISTGIDFSFEARLPGSGVDFSLTPFYQDYEDLIDFDFATFRLINRGSVEARGVETRASWSGRLFQAGAQATWQSVEDQDTGEELLRRPDWFGAGWLSWTPSARFSVVGDLRLNGDSLDEQVPSDGVETVEGSARLGAGLHWTPLTSWQLRFRVDNLTDEEYETRLGFPGSGRAVRVGVRWQR